MLHIFHNTGFKRSALADSKTQLKVFALQWHLATQTLQLLLPVLTHILFYSDYLQLKRSDYLKWSWKLWLGRAFPVSFPALVVGRYCLKTYCSMATYFCNSIFGPSSASCSSQCLNLTNMYVSWAPVLCVTYFMFVSIYWRGWYLIKDATVHIFTITMGQITISKVKKGPLEANPQRIATWRCGF